uniref:Reverse transcriptase Ty1/copia-type domain-containing protein n=1 Tax=Gossypium raimondii TaxID=29730 RepID=A0A0D2SNN3_GOSRA|nr:hypothetical protein B456_007G328100 [Gossypium raimondii]
MTASVSLTKYKGKKFTKKSSFNLWHDKMRTILVVEETTTSSLWLWLESKYMTKSLTNRLYLKQQLYTLKMEKGTPISQHLNTFNYIIMDLKNNDIKIDDEVRSLIVMCSLSRSYENFVDTMLYNHCDISLKDVKMI